MGEQRVSANSGKPLRGVFRVASEPQITANAAVGATLRAKLGEWSPTPSHIEYQWLRDGRDIREAWGRAYKVRAEDVGHTIALRVRASLPGYAAAERTSAPMSIPLAPFDIVSPTLIQGVNQLGNILHVYSDPWSPRPNWTRYQWFRDDSPIDAATDATYCLTEDDLGHEIRVRAKRRAPGVRQTIEISEAVVAGGTFDHPRAGELLATGAFDVEYYCTVWGLGALTGHEAASHYISVGMREAIAPNCFIDVAQWPAHLRQILTTGDVTKLCALLASPGYLPEEVADSRDIFTPASPGVPSRNMFAPGFDAEVLSQQGDLSGGTGTSPDGIGPLGRFMAQIDDHTTLAVPETSVLRGRNARLFRSDVIDGIRILRIEEEVQEPREMSEWDATREEAWKHEVRAFPLEEEPLVSIVMPVWNRRDVVGQAIDSVLAQTYRNWELLIVDDFSTDGSLDYLRTRAKEDPRISVSVSSAKGVCPARNTGVNQAQGEFLAFLDSDNQWRDDYLELMIRAMVRDNLLSAYSGELINRGHGLPSTYRAFDGDRRAMYYLNHIDLNVFVVRTALAHELGGFDEDLRRWVDYDFIFRVDAIARPALLPFIGCDYTHDMKRADRLTVFEASYWRWVVLGKAMQDWEAEKKKTRVPGRVSVVLASDGNRDELREAMETLLDNACVDDLEVIVMEYGSKLKESAAMMREWAGQPGVVYRHLSRSYNYAGNRNLGFLESTGEYVLFLHTNVALRPGGLQPLVDALKDPEVLGVQPVILTVQGNIYSAGQLWLAQNFLPINFLRGLPRGDADRVRSVRFPSVNGNAVMVRAHDFAAVRGFDCRYISDLEDTDFCLRLGRERSGYFAVEPRSAVLRRSKGAEMKPEERQTNRVVFLTRWRDAMPAAQPEAFEAVGYSLENISVEGAPDTQFTPVPVLRRTGTARRWGIKISSPESDRGDRWGDTHYAESLAYSLRAMGQEVVIYRRAAERLPGTQFDDVSVVIHGRRQAIPLPGQVNILWVISHPEDVTELEVQGFDAVLASSEPWARRMSKEWGIPVGVLHQATDADRFHWKSTPRPQVDAVFVGGNFPPRIRQVVHDAIEAGISLRVYGPMWEGQIPDKYYGGAYVANEELADVYRSARFVLADHWDDMADEGFVQNRLFDAVAAGRRVISDRVSGLREVFSEHDVAMYDSPEDIRRIVEESRTENRRRYGKKRAPKQRKTADSEQFRKAASERVLAQHSFDARARFLLSLVERIESAKESPTSSPG